MIDKNQIEQWLHENLITQEQAKKMLLDVMQKKQETTSNKITIAISTIGSLFLGIGAILFVASNWQLIPNVIKASLLIGSTFGTYAVGYLLKYKLQNLPKVGASLLFLGSLLFGTSIFLIAQMYHVNANNHTLVLIWLIGVLPLVYAFLSIPIALLSIFLSYLWVGLFLHHNYISLYWYHGAYNDATLIPILYVLLGVFLFSLGSLHYFFNKLKNIAQIYRLAGINTIMFCLFFLSFRFIYAINLLGYPEYAASSFSIRFLSSFLSLPAGKMLFIWIILCSIFNILFSVISSIYNPSKSKFNILESILSVTITLSALLCFFVVTTTSFYLLLFNFILLNLIFLLIIFGYRKEDIRLINVGMLWLAAFIAARYFDFFWNFLSRSLFFIIGGLILVFCGIILERKRRELKNELEQPSKHTTIDLSRKKYIFILLGFFWLAIIGGYIVIKEHILRTGQEVILKTVPVDPRDLFRGDYVILKYPISTINMKTLPTEKNDFNVGDHIFVELSIKDDYAEASRINASHKKDTLAIQGTVKDIVGNQLYIEYGIESYFVPENKGKEIERMVGKNIDVRAMISKSGKAIIKTLLIDGKEIT